MSETLQEVGTTQLDFTKNPTQQKFMESSAPYQCYSGGFGSGKTSACCMKTQILSSQIKNNMGVICRETYPDLKDSTRKVFFEILNPDWIRNWKESENALTLKNGSTVLFRHFETGRIKVGANLGWFFIDQAEEAAEEIFLALQGRLRRNVPKQYGLIAMNPNGQDWQWRMFVKNENPRYVCFNSTSYDNAANLQPNYIQDMLDNYPPEWIDRFVYGKWTNSSGLIYHEFDEEKHMVDPFDIPASWVKCRGNDWGVDAPATCVFIAQNPAGDYYVFDEYGEMERTAEEHADAIRNKSKPYGAFRASVLDQSAWQRGSELKSVADKYRDKGYICLPATKDLLGSILHVKHLLKTGKLLFFRGRTDSLIEEMRKWKWGAKREGKEVPARGNDHYLDAMRYVLHWMHRKQFYAMPGIEEPVRRQVGTLRAVREPIESDPVTGLPA